MSVRSINQAVGRNRTRYSRQVGAAALCEAHLAGIVRCTPAAHRVGKNDQTFITGKKAEMWSIIIVMSYDHRTEFNKSKLNSW